MEIQDRYKDQAVAGSMTDLYFVNVRPFTVHVSCLSDSDNRRYFSGYLRGERQLSSVLPMFTLDWDLFSLVFFSFSISSDLKPGRIILTCLKAIFNLTLSLSSSPMNVNHRANIQGQLIQPTLCRAKIKHFLVPLCFFSPPLFKKLFFGTKDLMMPRLPQQMQ